MSVRSLALIPAAVVVLTGCHQAPPHQASAQESASEQRANTQSAKSLPRPAAVPSIRPGDPAPLLDKVTVWKGNDKDVALKAGVISVIVFSPASDGLISSAFKELSELSLRNGSEASFLGIVVPESETTSTSSNGDLKSQAQAATFTVAVDQDGAAASAWIGADGKHSLPVAFIVDRNRRIAWIGHPTGLSRPLDDVVKGQRSTQPGRRQMPKRNRPLAL